VGPSRLQADLRRVGDTGVLRLDGEIDIATAPVLAAALHGAVEAVPAVPTIVIDLGEVVFCGARGMGSLLDTADAVARRAGRLVLANRPPPIRRLMEVLGVAARPHPLALDPMAVELTVQEASAGPCPALR
jgi:anti-anti-sigma factor